MIAKAPEAVLRSECALSGFRCRGGALRVRSVGLLFVLCTFLASGCVTRGVGSWGDVLSEADRSGALADMPVEARDALLPLSEIFYERITSRRFNSRATFEDPSVRQFFPSVAAYSDYYAALVDDLDRAYILYNRPTRVDLTGIERSDSGSLLLALRFVGDNDLPLRWWSAELERVDEWQWRDGRWYVVPGKV
ncbi:MAG: hypothetical protein AB8G23_00400 [Myxococcota bacterium]